MSDGLHAVSKKGPLEGTGKLDDDSWSSQGGSVGGYSSGVG